MTPKTSKELSPYLGAVNQFNRFISTLAELCHELRLLLKKDQPWKWEEQHYESFQKLTKRNSNFCMQRFLLEAQDPAKTI